MDRLPSEPRITVIGASNELFHRGYDLYRRRDDKDWLLTDCISFVAMEEHGITEGLTADHHSEQAGSSTTCCSSLMIISTARVIAPCLTLGPGSVS